MAPSSTIPIGELSRLTGCNIETIRARELGFPLDTVRTLLLLAEGGGHSCDQARHMAESQLADVLAKRADLDRMAAVLGDLVEACGAGVARGCPLLEALSD